MLFWRTFIVLVLHYYSLVTTMALSIKIKAYGQNTQDVVPDVVVRPSEDTATMFAFVK